MPPVQKLTLDHAVGLLARAIIDQGPDDKFRTRLVEDTKETLKELGLPLDPPWIGFFSNLRRPAKRDLHAREIGLKMPAAARVTKERFSHAHAVHILATAVAEPAFLKLLRERPAGAITGRGWRVSTVPDRWVKFFRALRPNDYSGVTIFNVRPPESLDGAGTALQASGLEGLPIIDGLPGGPPIEP